MSNNKKTYVRPAVELVDIYGSIALLDLSGEVANGFDDWGYAVGKENDILFNSNNGDFDDNESWSPWED